MSSASPSPSPTPDVADSSGEGLISTLAIGVGAFTILTLIFTLLRRRCAELYHYRAFLKLNRRDLDDFNARPVDHPDLPAEGLFAWIPGTLRVSDDDLFARVGLDATMYCRLLRFGIIIFSVISLITFIILVPLYATGPNKDLIDDSLRTEGIAIISLSNITSASDRIWGAWFIDIVICYLVLYLLHREIRQYSRYRRWYRAQERPSNYSVAVYDIPTNARSDKDVRDFFEHEFPGQVVDAHLVQNASPILKLKNEFLKCVAKRELAEWKMANDKRLDGDRPTHAVGGKLCCGGEQVDSIDYWQGEQDRLSEEIAEKQAAAAPPDVEPTGQAFVTFRSKRVASYAAQTQLWKKASQWQVQLAPDPKSVSWSSVGKTKIMELVFETATMVSFFVFLAFWSAISVFVQSVANVTKLAQTDAFDFLQPLVELSPFITGLLERFLPPILAIVLNLLPLILLKVFVGLERHSSIGDSNLKFIKYGYAFQFIQIFLLGVLSGSFLENVNVILDANFSEIIDLLANAVPKQATFFINYILTLTFIARGVQISQIVRLIVQTLLGFISKTERQKRGMRQFGSLFPYHIHYVMVCLVITLGLVYSTIAPLICVVAILFMAVTYLCHRYLLAFSLNLPYDGGGQTFQNVVWVILWAVLFKQIMMIGIFLVFKRPVAAALSLVNVPAILLFGNYVRKHHVHIWTWGSLSSLSNHGTDRDECAPHYDGLYRHPGTVPLEPVEDLSGIEVSSKDAFFESEQLRSPDKEE